MSKLIHIIGISLGILCIFSVSGADYTGFRQIYDPRKFIDYTEWANWGEAVRNVMFQIFKNLAVAVFILAVILAFVSVIQLLISENGEEDFSKWMKTLVWSIAGLFLISISYTIIRQFEQRVLLNPTLSARSIFDLTINIIYPILNFLRYMAATAFLLSALYAFFRIITAAGAEEWLEEGKKIFIGSVLGFVVMMFAEPIVRLAYGGGSCGSNKVFGVGVNCVNRVFDTAGAFAFIAKVIVFLNWFLALTVTIMIIYAGFLVLTGGGEEEKSDKAKNIIKYAIIGILMLLFSYVIFRFLILQG